MSRSLRPGVVALVPVGCNAAIHCSDVLNALAGQANEVGYPLDVVLPATPQAQPDHQGRSTPGGRGYSWTSHSPSHQARSLYALAKASGLTALLVQRNGVIFDRFTNVTGSISAINAELVTMSEPRSGG